MTGSVKSGVAPSASEASRISLALNPDRKKSFSAPVIWLRGPALPTKIFLFFGGQITGLLRPSCPARGDVGHVTDVGTGCGGRGSVVARFMRADERR